MQNFAVTQSGLEDQVCASVLWALFLMFMCFPFFSVSFQLLGVVVSREDASLEEDKQRCVTAVTAGKRKLIELEDLILSLLKNAQGC